MSAVPGKSARRANSQAVKAQLEIRDLILNGKLRPGERLSELSMVELLGVSRTPVRTALVRLEEEGLLEAIPSGGFAVREFSERDIFDAIELRGTLEGLAARLAAERGVSDNDLEPVRECLLNIDRVLARAPLSVDAFSEYVELNVTFHQLLVGLAGSHIIAREAERVSALPFASPSALVMAQSVGADGRRVLLIAEEQHRCVVEAIERREGARAESIMREHARLSARNLARVLHSPPALRLVVGGSLVREGDHAPTGQ